MHEEKLLLEMVDTVPQWYGCACGPYLHGLTVNAVTLCVMLAAAGMASASTSLRWLMTTLATVVVLNGALHITTSALTRSYSPGVVSGLCLWLPLGGIGGGIASTGSTRIVNSAIGGNFATVLGDGLYLGADATLMQVTVADVGQGSAILVRTRTHALLHDAGAQYSRDSDAGTRVLVPLLRALGVPRIDVMMLSHRDNDHVGGAAALLASMPVAALSSSLEPTHPLRAVALPQQRCEAGQSWRWDGVEFRVLHPSGTDYGRAAPKPNTLSCTLAVTDAQGRQLLLTGDLEAEQEARLVQEHGHALRSEVLVVPHHGSRTSSTAAFVAAAMSSRRSRSGPRRC